MASPSRMAAGIDLDQYRTQAKELLRAVRAAQPAALARLRQHHPGHGEAADGIRLARLADTQLVVARENGCPSWARFKELLLFRNAVAALDAGDLPRLGAILDENPRLVRHRCRTGEPYEDGYFAGATLLHHLAGNPDRGPLPRNILDGARLLIRRGFDPGAAAETIRLLLTSRRAAEAGVALAIVDLLVQAGGHLHLEAPDILDLPLLNVAPATAEALVGRGARLDLRHAAALGNLEALRTLLAATATRERLEEALVFACVRGQRGAASMLLEHGARGDVLIAPGGQTPRTALHEAANRGHRDVVALLLDNGADAAVVEPRWGGTAAGWADHGGHPEIAALIRQRHSETLHGQRT
jgi:hypothetical protein